MQMPSNVVAVDYEHENNKDGLQKQMPVAMPASLVMKMEHQEF